MLDWLEQDLSLVIRDYSPASSDASFRRYFRINTEQNSFIVMDAPPDKENIEPFIKVAHLLRHSGINVPDIFHQNRILGFLVLEDFGSTCFLDRLRTSDPTPLYQSALASLLRQQTQTSITDSDLPAYDRELLTRELTIFDEWFLGRHLELTLPTHIQTDLHTLLIESALEQPSVCVHRDYHSRNLMALEPEGLGVIDFQDAVIGPITYDLVSLLKDCYIDWPKDRIDDWMTGYYVQLQQAGLIDCSLGQFTRWFNLMGLQRHLKAIGIFSRLHWRDHKSGYLRDIPRTLNYVVDTCERYPELTTFSDFLQRHVLPAYTQSK